MVFSQKKKYKPDFLIIGAQKGGTTTFYDLLTQHPEINPAKKKEVHYFDLNFHRPLRWYHSFFSYGKVTGEASPYYLFHPLVPKRIKTVFPNIKIIVLLRNPTERAFSHYNMEFNRGIETYTFEQAIDRETKILKGEKEKIQTIKNYHSYNYQHFSYLARGRYHEQLKEWFRFFPRNQFLFIKSEQFFLKPQFFLNEVYSFLDLKPFNATMKILMKGKYGDEISDETRDKLNKYFMKSNNELYKLLGVNYEW